MAKIDWTKPIRVVNGHQPRRFVCRDPEGNSRYPVIYDAAGTLYRATDDGVSEKYPVAIENVPPEPVVTFRNIYSLGNWGIPHISAEHAKINGKETAAAVCVLRIETVDGVRTKVEVVHTY